MFLVCVLCVSVSVYERVHVFCVCERACMFLECVLCVSVIVILCV